MVQWLGLRTPNAEVLGSIPDQGTRSHTLQLRARRPQLKDVITKILQARTKTQHSHINT